MGESITDNEGRRCTRENWQTRRHVRRKTGWTKRLRSTREFARGQFWQTRLPPRMYSFALRVWTRVMFSRPGARDMPATCRAAKACHPAVTDMRCSGVCGGLQRNTYEGHITAPNVSKGTAGQWWGWKGGGARPAGRKRPAYTCPSPVEPGCSKALPPCFSRVYPASCRCRPVVYGRPVELPQPSPHCDVVEYALGAKSVFRKAGCSSPMCITRMLRRNR